MPLKQSRRLDGPFIFTSANFAIYARIHAAANKGRISVAKRRHGLNRCRYKGENGMKRWVGLGVISDNLINIGRAIAKQTAKAAR